MIPADTVSFNDASRITILRQINGCETEGKLLNTHVVDQLLSVFHSNTCFIFPTYSTVSGNMSPYYGRFIGKSRLDDAVELIVLPLCDGSHFNGYIVDLVNKAYRVRRIDVSTQIPKEVDRSKIKGHIF